MPKAATPFILKNDTRENRETKGICNIPMEGRLETILKEYF